MKADRSQVCRVGGARAAGIRRDRRRHRRGEGGVSMVEFALMGPVFFIVSLGLLIFSLVVMNTVQLSNAVRDGARAAAICGGVGRNTRSPVPTMPDGVTACSTSALISYITSKLNAVPGGVVPVITVTANAQTYNNIDSCDYGGIVDIRVAYKQPLYMPLLGGIVGDGAGTSTRTINVDAQAVCEQ